MEEEEEKVGENWLNSFDGIFLSNWVEDCIVLCKLRQNMVCQPRDAVTRDDCDVEGMWRNRWFETFLESKKGGRLAINRSRQKA
jgi:uncharacterized protein (DUF2235 family)